MGDTAEKKEKSKKKKSVKKEAPEAGAATAGDSLAPPEQKERKKSLSAEPKAEGNETKSRKSSSAIDAPESKSRKSSSVKEPAPLKAEEPAASADEAAAVPAEEEEDEMPIMPPPPRVWDPDKTPFEAITEAENLELPPPDQLYVAPPQSTKKDVDLLLDLDTRRLAELMEAFAMFDFDQDGIITHHDLKRVFASIDQQNVTDEELEKMLSEGLSPLDFDNFVVLMGYKTLEMDPEEVLSEALSQWDYGTHGLISEERLKHDIMTWGDRFTEEEAEEALADAPVVQDKNKDKMINYVKFSNDLCGLRKRMKQKYNK